MRVKEALAGFIGVISGFENILAILEAWGWEALRAFPLLSNKSQFTTFMSFLCGKCLLLCMLHMPRCILAARVLCAGRLQMDGFFRRTSWLWQQADDLQLQALQRWWCGCGCSNNLGLLLGQQCCTGVFLRWGKRLKSPLVSCLPPQICFKTQINGKKIKLIRLLSKYHHWYEGAHWFRCWKEYHKSKLCKYRFVQKCKEKPDFRISYHGR